MPKTYPLLTEEARKKRLEYLREWRKRNPEKVRQYVINTWNRKAERENQQSESEGRD